MKVTRSKSWYEKKAKLESGCSVSAGSFPSTILSTKGAPAAKATTAFVKKIRPAKDIKAS
jgi:hypothetical protein